MSGMGPKADFHIHTTKSDGSLSPAAIVKKFKEDGYDIIAITDHDGIDGVREAKIAGEAMELTIIPGIELATCISLERAAEWGMELPKPASPDRKPAEIDENGMVHGTENELDAHLLGYKYDLDNPELNRMVEILRQSRYDRNIKLVEALNAKGYAMTYDEIRASHTSDYVGKPVIARFMASKGYIENPIDAFGPKVFDDPEIAAIKRDKLDIVAAIKLINEAGGIPVLAHPMKLKGLGERGSEQFWNNLDHLLRGLKKSGLKGLECGHTSHSHDEMLRLTDYAEKYHLHMTHGSDFHGDDMPH